MFFTYIVNSKLYLMCCANVSISELLYQNTGEADRTSPQGIRGAYQLLLCTIFLKYSRACICSFMLE